MARLYDTTFTNGDVLTRMLRTASFGDRYCQEPDCDSAIPVRNVWGFTPAREGFIGWRSACSKKHAISIWMREVTAPVELADAASPESAQ